MSLKSLILQSTFLLDFDPDFDLFLDLEKKNLKLCLVCFRIFDSVVKFSCF